MKTPSSTSTFYSVGLSPEDARSAATTGTSLLLLDVPQGTVVGIDHRSFVVGPNFKGIKMIPPAGVHFVSTNATSDVRGENTSSPPPPPSVGPTNFFFFHAKPSSVIIRRWSTEHEVLLPLEDEDEERRFVAGVENFDFDSGLAPYDLSSWPLWKSLTRFVSEETVKRIAPKSEKVVAMSVVSEADEVERRRKEKSKGRSVVRPTVAEKRLEEQLERGRERLGLPSSSEAAPQPVPDVVGAPRYAQLPRHAVVVGGGGGGDDDAVDDKSSNTSVDKDKQTKGRLLTAANLDKTSTLVSVVRSSSYPFRGDARELLGEFQHAFLSFLAGHSLLAFAAWRDALRLVFSCDSGPCLPSLISSGAKEDRFGKEIDGEWFRAFVETLSAQLEVATATSTTKQSSSPAAASSPLVDDLLYDSFLRKSARRFLEGVREAAEEGGGFEVDGGDGGGGQTTTSSSRLLPAPSPELLASCARLSRVFEERLGWAGLGRPRLRELRISDGGGGGDGGDEESDDDSDGPVVVDLEKGY